MRKIKSKVVPESKIAAWAKSKYNDASPEQQAEFTQQLSEVLAEGKANYDGSDPIKDVEIVERDLLKSTKRRQAEAQNMLEKSISDGDLIMLGDNALVQEAMQPLDLSKVTKAPIRRKESSED